MVGEGRRAAYSAVQDLGFLLVDGVDLAFGQDGVVARVEGDFILGLLGWCLGLLFGFGDGGGLVGFFDVTVCHIER